MRSLNLEGVEGKTDITKGRLKIIAKYIDLFEFLFVCSFIEQRLIHVLLGVGERTVERWLHDILNDSYGKDLIKITKDGKINRIHLSSEFYTTIGSGDRFNNKRISKRKYRNALLRALQYKFYNKNSNKEISDFLIENNLQEEPYIASRRTKDNLIEWDEMTYNYLESVEWTGLDNLCMDDEKIYIDSVYVCSGEDINEIILAYDKVLTLMEYLMMLDYKGFRAYDVEIDFTVVTLERVNIREYIYSFQRAFRKYDRYKSYHCFVGKKNTNRGKREFFAYYRNTCPLGTKFCLFSKETQSFIEYGNR